MELLGPWCEPFFSQHYKLVDEKELAPLKELIDSMMGKAKMGAA